MSYYTYFYPKKDLYNDRGLSEKQLNQEIQKKENDLAESRIEFKAAMISAYYEEDLKKAAGPLRFYWHVYIWNLEELNRLQWASRIQNDLKEYKDGAVGINHADCDSEYELQDDIQSFKNTLNNLLGDLVVLSRIKFVPKPEKDGNGYYRDDEDSNTEMNYLRYKYQQEIDEILDTASEIESDISDKQFMLDAYEGHETEDERYEKEKKEKNDSETQDSSTNSDQKTISFEENQE